MSATDAIYEEVTGQVIAALERGTVPWRQPWAAAGEPLSLQTGRPYRGVNVLLLGMRGQAEGYSSPYWVTFKQAQTRGGNVRKGERSQSVVFWKMLKGKDEKSGKDRMIPLLRRFRVFNAEQCDGLGELPGLPEPLAFSPDASAQTIVDRMPQPPTLAHGGGRAFYRPKDDHVQLPDPEGFESIPAYYATAFHELVHSTGHESRLNREGIAQKVHWGSEDYSREELVAELGAAMLCGVSRLEVRVEQSAAYIASWLNALRDDPKMLVWAGGRAQRAADFILDRNVEVAS